jgi:iron(III) transport system substrate-binding protein
MLMAAALAALVACSRGATPSSVPPADRSTAAQPASPGGEWDQLVAAARQEGELVVLGPPTQDLREALNNTFAKQYAVSVSYVAGVGNEHIAKLRAERAAGRFTSDVVMSGAPSWWPVQDEMLAPVRPLLVLPEVTNPSNWLDGKLWWVDKEQEKLLRLSLYLPPNLTVNPDIVDPRSIVTWPDVMDPRHRGKLTSQTVTRPGPGAGTASYLWYALGDEKFRRLYLDQAVVFTDDTRQAAEWVARGTRPIGLGIDASFIEPFKKEGLKIEVVRPPDAPGYLSSGFGTLALIDRPAHPNAAKLFINWSASRAGAEVIGRAMDNVSARSDVSNDWAPEYTRPKPGQPYVDIHAHEYLSEIRPASDNAVRDIMGGR